MQKTNLKIAAKCHLQPEWSRQDALWTAWPSHADEGRWPPETMEKARAEIAQMVREVAAGQAVNVLAMGEEPVRNARAEHPGPDRLTDAV